MGLIDVKIKNKKYKLFDRLIDELDFLRECNAKNFDAWMIIDGGEGLGKSLGLAIPIACALDNSFNIDRLVFTQDQFNEAVDNAKPEQAIVWDEFILGGLSTEAMTNQQSMLLKKSVTMRKKRLYIILVVSRFKLIREYFAVDRSRYLIRATTPDGISRGYFELYGYKSKKQRYQLEKNKFQKFTIKMGTPDFNGRFIQPPPNYFINEESYDEKKEKAIIQISEGKEDLKSRKYKEKIQKEQLKTNTLLKHFNKKRMATHKELGAIIGIKKTAILERIAKV